MYKIQTKLFKPINSALYINVYTLWFGVIFFFGGDVFLNYFFLFYILFVIFFLRFFSIQNCILNAILKKKILNLIH